MTAAARPSAPALDRGLLVAPTEHMGVLVAAGPPVAAVRDVPLLDAPLSTIRAALRRELGLAGPVVLTGHQPEFYHAGVLAKNLAAADLAAACGGAAAFLVVDSDTPRSASVRVPQRTPAGPRRIELAIPGCDPRLSHEQQPARPRRHWLDFFVQWAGLRPDYAASGLRPFADAWLGPGDTAEPVDMLAAFDRGRRATEAASGIAPLPELRISRLAQTGAFRMFAAHLLAHAGDFRAHYNAAQAAYRRRHRIRAVGRPVPPLLLAEERIETPFWAVRGAIPRRRLFVRQRADAVELLAETEPIGLLDARTMRSADRAAAADTAADGWQVRPRALALSAFARLVVADEFLHGIGGAKYDEITDDFLATFLPGCAPARLWCVSATLRLDPDAPAAAAADDLRAARRRSRDLRYNPQRYIAAPPALAQERAAAVRESDRLRAARSRDRAARRAAWDAIRQANRRILELDPWRAAAFDEAAAAIEARDTAEAILRDREYCYAMHPVAALRELRARVAAAVSATRGSDQAGALAQGPLG